MDMSGHQPMKDQAVRNRAPDWHKAWRVLWLPLVLLVAAFLLHWNRFGAPTAGLDEQFYLLVGDRIWSGALPYVDIWDRKPPGLFLIYAAIRALPGNGIVAYQIVATVLMAANGWLAALIARRSVGDVGALAAGFITIGYATLMGEGFGQAPIFYGPLISLAALAILRVYEDPASARAPVFAGAAMLLCGTAITIKTVAIFESLTFGLALIAVHARTGLGRQALALRATIWLAIGAAPMLIFATGYVASGHFDAFWFANVVSILHRQGGLGPSSDIQLVATLLLLAPLVSVALLGGYRADTAIRHDRPLIIAWAAAATAGMLSIGYFYFHYALPVIVPLAVLIAHALGRGWLARPGLALVGAGVIALVPYSDLTTRQDQRDIAALLDALPAQVATQCLLVLQGPAIIYHLSHACLASPYAFPGHFAQTGEQSALGKPVGTILKDALARRPAAIITAADPKTHPPLLPYYRPTPAISIRLYGATHMPLIIWVRADLIPVVKRGNQSHADWLAISQRLPLRADRVVFRDQHL